MCIKILKLSFFCCTFPDPICVIFILKDYKSLELGTVFCLCLPVIIGHCVLRPLTKFTIAILTARIYFLFLHLFIFCIPLSCMMKINCTSFTPFIILYFSYNTVRFAVNTILKVKLAFSVPLLQNKTQIWTCRIFLFSQ